MDGEQHQDYRYLIGRGVLRSWSGLHILDLGCGQGLYCAPLSRFGAHVVGADRGLNYLLTARRHQPTTGLAQCDASALPFSDAVFEAVISTEVLTHIAPDVRIAVYQEIRRVLKPGGECLVTLHNRRRLGWRYVIRRHPVPDMIPTPGLPVYPEDDATITPQLQALGFEVLEGPTYLNYHSWLTYQRHQTHPCWSRVMMSAEDALSYIPGVRRLSIVFLLRLRKPLQ